MHKVGELIDAVADSGECDLVARPRHSAADVHDRDADGPARGRPRRSCCTGPTCSPPATRSCATIVVKAVGDWNDYILAHAATVRGRGNDDLISLMCDAERDGKRLTDVDLMFESMLVLVGGDETTRHVISAGVDALLRHPDQLALLRDDPVADSVGRRGDAALGDPGQEHEPHGDPRRRAVRPADARGRPDAAAVPVGQP